MSRGVQDPFKERREAVFARDSTNPTNPKVREIEIYLLRYGAASHSPIKEIENVMPGGGILVAYGLFGEKFKIEITQVDGPQ